MLSSELCCVCSLQRFPSIGRHRIHSCSIACKRRSAIPTHTRLLHRVRRTCMISFIIVSFTQLNKEKTLRKELSIETMYCAMQAS